jgi:hypothetical protein
MEQARMDRPPTIQLTLPLRHGGLGLVHTGPEEGNAANLFGVATTQIAVRHGPAEFRPFEGPIDAQLRRSPQSTWFRRLATETGTAAASQQVQPGILYADLM